MQLARATEDVELLKKLEQHPQDIVSNVARSQLKFLETKNSQK